MISRSVTLSTVPVALSKTFVQDTPASVLRQMVASKPAPPKSAPPSKIRLALLRLKRTALRSDSNKGPWLGPSGVQVPLFSRRYNPSGATVDGPVEMAYSLPSGANRTALYRVGGADSRSHVTPASRENRLSSEMPLEDCTK